MKTLIVAGLALVAFSLPASAGFGAISYSEADGVIGTSFGSATLADAERWALYDCRERGGRDCRSIVWQRNRCAVLVVTADGRATWGTSNMGVARAEVLAKEACPTCRTAAWSCDYPETGSGQNERSN
jgi:hypothetical protein